MVLDAAKCVLGIESPCLWRGINSSILSLYISKRLEILKSFFVLCSKSDTYINCTSHYKSGSSHAHVPSMVLNPSMVLHRHWLAELFMAKSSICKKIYLSLFILVFCFRLPLHGSREIFT